MTNNKFMTTEALLEIPKTNISYARRHATKAKEIYEQCLHDSESLDSIKSIRKMNTALAHLNQAQSHICCLITVVLQMPETVEIKFIPEIIQNFQTFNDEFLSSYLDGHSVQVCFDAYEAFNEICQHWRMIYFPV